MAVTAEVTPHHLALTEEARGGYDTVFKVNPPLRTAPTCWRCAKGVLDGAIDAIATDHAPHPPAAKQVAFCDAAPGMTGLGNRPGRMRWSELSLPIEKVLALMSWAAGRDRRLVARHGGPVAPGAPANLCVVRPVPHMGT